MLPSPTLLTREDTEPQRQSPGRLASERGPARRSIGVWCSVGSGALWGPVPEVDDKLFSKQRRASTEALLPD